MVPPSQRPQQQWPLPLPGDPVGLLLEFWECTVLTPWSREPLLPSLAPSGCTLGQEADNGFPSIMAPKYSDGSEAVLLPINSPTLSRGTFGTECSNGPKTDVPPIRSADRSTPECSNGAETDICLHRKSHHLGFSHSIRRSILFPRRTQPNPSGRPHLSPIFSSSGHRGNHRSRASLHFNWRDWHHSVPTSQHPFSAVQLSIITSMIRLGLTSQ